MCRLNTYQIGFFVVVLSTLAACGGSARRVVEEDRIERLRLDINKVSFAIRTTKILIARSHGTEYAPDLYNRLAELYIEQARYHYQIAFEKQKEKSGGVVSVPTRLLKNQAIATYRRLLALFPDYRDADKVMFFMAHEMRELGDYENMLKTYQALADKYPKSIYRLEGLLVMGDYHFDRAELDQAAKYYQQVLEAPETHVHAMARYKMAWVEVNKADYKSALKLFEGAISAARKFIATTSGKSKEGEKIDIRREALVDSVYCYTEVYKPKGALDYFRERADSKTTYLAALDKLGNRYYVKQDWVATATVYREILSLTGDVEDAVEYAHRLYESITQGKIYDQAAQDVSALVRVIRRRYYNNVYTEQERKKLFDTFEQYTRDIGTRLNEVANQTKDKEKYLGAADAYRAYLTFFNEAKHAGLVRANLAEALYAAKRSFDAGKYYELAANVLKGNDRQEAIYTAVVAYFQALTEQKQELSRLEEVQARAGLRRSGQAYLREFKGSNANESMKVKFNIARTFYDAGEFEDAIRLFTAFTDQFPSQQEATVAAQLVLDAHNSRENYEGLILAASDFQRNAQLGDAEFKNELAQTIKRAQERIVGRETMRGEEGEEGGGAESLLQFAEGKACTGMTETALVNAFDLARNAKDPEKIFEVGDKIRKQCPKSTQLPVILAELGKIALNTLQFARGATYLQEAAALKRGAEAKDLYLAAGTIWAELGERNAAEQLLGQVLRLGSTEEKTKLSLTVSRLHMQANDWNGVIGTLKRALSSGATSAEMVYRLAYAQFRQEQLADAEANFNKAVSEGSSAADEEGREAAAAAQFYLAELTFRAFKKIELSNDLNQLGASLQQKLGAMTQTRDAYRNVVKHGSAIWSVAALGRLASVDEDAAKALRGLTLPQGLPEDVIKQVQGALAQQAAPLEKESKEAIQQCADTAMKLKVMSEAAKACLAGRAPAEDPFRTTVAEIKRAHPEAAKQVQKQLATRPNDVENIHKLGKIYLGADDPYMARMIVNKALELKETANALNMLGVAEARLGEFQSAYLLFRKALKTDPTYFLAKANVTYLLHLFGYRKESDGMIKQLRGASGLSSGEAELIPGVAQLIAGGAS